jgi:hypothetical protein
MTRDLHEGVARTKRDCAVLWIANGMYVSGWRKYSNICVLAKQQDRQGAILTCSKVYTLQPSSYEEVRK